MAANPREEIAEVGFVGEIQWEPAVAVQIETILLMHAIGTKLAHIARGLGVGGSSVHRMLEG
jgi:hypothetical protein